MSQSTTRKASRARGGSAKRKRNERSLLVPAVVAVVVLFAAFVLLRDGDAGTAAAGILESPSGHAYQVGEPGPGEPAPPIQLQGTSGPFDLEQLRGQRVLLYFQEGLMCQPCWDQLVDIEKRGGDFQRLGIDAVVSVTTDHLGALRQKVEMEGISSPVLADMDKSVSRTYTTLDYGMMGGSHNGHTFIVVGRDGAIEWRADYGGAPDYTMYLPVDALLEDLEAGLEAAEQ
jgi:peroxiredoxin